eukprot:1153109-Pelagomonas_calceolata.AAC.10
MQPLLLLLPPLCDAWLLLLLLLPCVVVADVRRAPCALQHAVGLLEAGHGCAGALVGVAACGAVRQHCSGKHVAQL